VRLIWLAIKAAILRREIDRFDVILEVQRAMGVREAREAGEFLVSVSMADWKGDERRI
jgi:hypothetical protein